MCKWITLKGFTEDLCSTRLCVEQLRPAEVEQMEWDPTETFRHASDVGESWRRCEPLSPLSVPMCMPHVRGDGLDLHALTKDAIGAHDGAVHLREIGAKARLSARFNGFIPSDLPQSKAQQSRATHGHDYDYVRRGR